MRRVWPGGLHGMVCTPAQSCNRFRHVDFSLGHIRVGEASAVFQLESEPSPRSHVEVLAAACASTHLRSPGFDPLPFLTLEAGHGGMGCGWGFEGRAGGTQTTGIEARGMQIKHLGSTRKRRNKIARSLDGTDEGTLDHPST